MFLKNGLKLRQVKTADGVVRHNGLAVCADNVKVEQAVWKVSDGLCIWFIMQCLIYSGMNAKLIQPHTANPARQSRLNRVRGCATHPAHGLRFIVLRRFFFDSTIFECLQNIVQTQKKAAIRLSVSPKLLAETGSCRRRQSMLWHTWNPGCAMRIWLAGWCINGDWITGSRFPCLRY